MQATERLVEALQKNRQEISENRAIARQIADEVAIPLIDFPGVARGVLGSHWREASQEQRARFTQAFRRFLESVYVTAMAIYADQIISHARNISYPPLQLRDGSREAVVRTLIRLHGGMKVEGELHHAPCRWTLEGPRRQRAGDQPRENLPDYLCAGNKTPGTRRPDHRTRNPNRRGHSRFTRHSIAAGATLDTGC